MRIKFIILLFLMLAVHLLNLYVFKVVEVGWKIVYVIYIFGFNQPFLGYIISEILGINHQYEPFLCASTLALFHF
jgi:hypothetical protein